MHIIFIFEDFSKASFLQNIQVCLVVHSLALEKCEPQLQIGSAKLIFLLSQQQYFSKTSTNFFQSHKHEKEAFCCKCPCIGIVPFLERFQMLLSFFSCRCSHGSSWNYFSNSDLKLMVSKSDLPKVKGDQRCSRLVVVVFADYFVHSF